MNFAMLQLVRMNFMILQLVHTTLVDFYNSSARTHDLLNFQNFAILRLAHMNSVILCLASQPRLRP